jgi:hypothetical protein
MLISTNLAVPGIFNMNGYGLQCLYFCYINAFRCDWKFILAIFLNKHILEALFLTHLEFCIVVCIVAHKKIVMLGGGGYQQFGWTSCLHLWGRLNMDALSSYKTLVPIYRTWCHNLEDQSVNLDYFETSNLMPWNLYISVMLFLCVSQTVQSYYIVRSILLTWHNTQEQILHLQCLRYFSPRAYNRGKLHWTSWACFRMS